jgi:dynein heavy chain 1
MEVATPGANGRSPSPNPTTTLDPSLVVDYLSDLLEITLGATSADLEANGSLLSKVKRNDTVQRCTRFASEASQVVLYVQKDLVSPESGSNGHLNGSAGGMIS